MAPQEYDNHFKSRECLLASKASKHTIHDSLKLHSGFLKSIAILVKRYIPCSFLHLFHLVRIVNNCHLCLTLKRLQRLPGGHCIQSSKKLVCMLYCDLFGFAVLEEILESFIFVRSKSISKAAHGVIFRNYVDGKYTITYMVFNNSCPWTSSK